MKWLLARFNRSEVGDGKGNVFFWRYHIFKSARLSIYLHQFMRSDFDRCLHDHPWSFLAIVLKGGYWEEVYHNRGWEKVGESEWSFEGTVKVKRWRRPGSILYRPAEFSHRIEIEPGSKPWSLVFVGRKIRPWGFWTLDGWKAWIPGYSPICETTIPMEEPRRPLAAPWGDERPPEGRILPGQAPIP